MSRSIRMLATALALTVGTALAGASAATADPGDPTIAYGTVTEGNTGAALTNLQVVVYDADPAGDDVEPVATASTKADDPEIVGDYQVPLAPGHYWLVMSADDHQTLTVEKDVTDAAGGYQNLGGDYLEISTGLLAGSVTADGEPYDCAYIEIYDATGDGDDYVDYTYTGQSADQGAYSSSLPIGTYRVRVTDYCEDYVGQWVGGTSFADASTFTITADQTTTVPTVNLTDGATVSGRVTKAGGAGLDNVDVTLASSDGTDLLDSAVSGADGTYSFPHVGPGTYQLQFYDALGEYESKTVAVTVAATDVTGLTTVLDPTPASVDTNKLKGKVTGPTKAGIGGIFVRVFDEEYSFIATGRTRRDGTYSVNVPEGVYRVQFTPAEHREDRPAARGFADEDEVQTYRAEWFENANSLYRAKPVTVTAAGARADAELVKNAVISGTVKLSDGEDAYDYDVSVSVFDADGTLRAATYVDEDGRYSVAGLAPGTYRILADDEGGLDDDGNPYDTFIRQYFTNKYSLSTATAVVAGNGAVVTGRDVTLSDQLKAISAPKVSGTAKKGKKLTASVGSWTATVDTTYTYQWYRGSSKISGATKSSYTLATSDVNKQVKVVVTASNAYDNYRDGTSSSALTKKVVK